MVTHTESSTEEAATGGSQVPGQPELHRKILSQNNNNNNNIKQPVRTEGVENFL
jgi:hypothetical protein